MQGNIWDSWFIFNAPFYVDEKYNGNNQNYFVIFATLKITSDAEKRNLSELFCQCIQTTFLFLFLGGPVDLLSRRVLCASSQSLADQLSKAVPEHIDLDRD